MENKNTSVFMNALTWGIILGLVSIVYSVILYMVDQVFNQTLGYLSILILIAGLVISVKSYRDNVLEGEITFGKAFGFGVLVALVSAVLGAIYNYLLYTVIDPDLQKKMLEMAAEKMLEQGMPEGQIDQALEITKRFMSPVFTSIIAVFSGTLFGTIISLVVAAIFKKESE
ncbi:MAG: DUF4199 domain-containing protein [Bacteroidales bacterium]|nr:DUF4199 domain-containing protein [Bacteroidales bacterium]